MARSPKNSPNGKGILTAIAVIVLLNLSGEYPGILPLLIFLAVPVIVVRIILRAAKGGRQEPSEERTAAPARDPNACPRPVCRHDDKGEHHLKRGREIDPWDRPDIDISKYQHG